ncbi:hypothetical protein Tco_0364785 [Tanacetum coccineum]
MTSPTTYIDTTPIVIVLPTIPPSPNYTPTSPDYSPASDMESDPSEDPSSGHIPPLPATSPLISSTDDSSDSDIPDIPPSPTHGTQFTKTTLFTQSSSLETSSDSPVDALSDSASSHSSSDHSLPIPSHDSSSASPSRKRNRSPVASVKPRQGRNARRKQEWISSQHTVSL